MSVDIDYYELLGVERTADGQTIKTAYRKLAMQYHPDRNPGCNDSEAKFKAISAAYDCLKDSKKRALYDQYGHAAFQQGGGGGGGAGAQGFGDFADIFESFFGGGGFGGGRQRGPQRGADLRYDMEISLDEAFHGKQTEIGIDVSVACSDCEGTGSHAKSEIRTCPMCHGAGKVRAQQGFFVVERTCGSCHGRGEIIADPCRSCLGEGRRDEYQQLDVTIPPGVDNGTRIRLSGKGEAGPRGAAPGDLYIFLHVREHPIFVREGTTLATRVPVSFTTAALGGEIDLPGLDGEKIALKIPAGIQSGKQLRQRGAGMPVLQGKGRGDMVVQIEVETPTKLSAKQKELLREFQDTETGDECPESSGFFARIKEKWEDLTEK